MVHGNDRIDQFGRERFGGWSRDFQYKGTGYYWFACRGHHCGLGPKLALPDDKVIPINILVIVRIPVTLSGVGCLYSKPSLPVQEVVAVHIAVGIEVGWNATRVETMLESVLGQDKAIVRVSCLLNFIQQEKTEELFLPDNSVISERAGIQLGFK